jgi:5-methylcytosine-specific restriction endonuclease McrA
MSICGYCSASFVSRAHNTKYCSDCRQPGKGGLKPHLRLRKKGLKPPSKVGKGNRVVRCKLCDVEFRTYYKDQMYCSKSCGARDNADDTSKRLKLPDDVHVYRRWGRRKCVVAWLRNRANKRLATLMCKRARRKPRDCKWCSKSFRPKSVVQVYCSPSCGLSATKNKERMSRRAVVNGVEIEPFTWLEIAERDKWHCCMCGAYTPRHKRASYDDDAPEIDHVVPVSKGGEHSKSNAQLLCRSCNATKSDLIVQPCRLLPAWGAGV